MSRHTKRKQHSRGSLSASQKKKALEKELRGINRKILRFGSDEEDELRGILLSEGVDLEITNGLNLSELREYYEARTVLIENVGLEADDIKDLTFDEIVDLLMNVRETTNQSSQETKCTNLVEYEGQMVDPILYESPDINNDRITIVGTDLGPNVYCLDRLTFIKSLKVMAKWVPEYGRSMSPMGYGGVPDFDTLYFGSIGILNGLSGYIDEESIINLIRGPVTKGAIIQLIKVKDNERLGNVRGVFGVSMNHGQDPGFPIYKLESDSFYDGPRRSDTYQLEVDVYGDYVLGRRLEREMAALRATAAEFRRRGPRTVVGDPWAQLVAVRREYSAVREQVPREPRRALRWPSHRDPPLYEPEELASELGEELVGLFIFVRRKKRQGEYYYDYPGLVTDWDNSSGRHTVLYDDGDVFKEKLGSPDAIQRWYYDNERNLLPEAEINVPPLSPQVKMNIDDRSSLWSAAVPDGRRFAEFRLRLRAEADARERERLSKEETRGRN